jgi:predicted Ser/Thr protein kinase
MPLPCPDENLLNRFVSRQLDADERRRTEEHLDECMECLHVVAAMARPSAAATIPTETLSAGGAPLASEPVVGRYRIEEKLGEGGMGTVFVAFDHKLDRRVALKVVRGDRAAAASGRARMTREAKTMAKLAHTNVVAVYDTGEIGDGVYIAMELVEGVTLAEWIREKKRPRADVIAAFSSAGRGLAAAHAIGVVHRDFKPENVLVGRNGRIAVTDFGLALAGDRAAEEPAVGSPDEAPPSNLGATLTRPGTVLGTPRYMSPEQRAGAKVDARSDQYSFALALYEALFGAPPFAAEPSGAEHDARDPPKLRDPSFEARAGVPVRLARALRRALAPEPDDRFPSLDALLDEIAPYAAPPSRRRGATLLAAGVAVVAASIGGAAWLGRAPGQIARAPASTPTGAPEASSPTFGLGFAGAPRRLTDGQCEEYPSPTPDGRAVIYDAVVGSDSFIFRLTLDGGGPTALINDKGWAFGPSVSPGGERFAFVHGDADGSLMVAPLDGHEAPRRLGPATTRPAWSPDGKGLWAGNKRDLVERDAETGAELRVLHLEQGRAESVLELADSTVVATVGTEGLTVAGRLVAFSPGNAAPRTLVDGDIRAMEIAPSGHILVDVRVPGGAATLLDVPVDGAGPSPVGARGIVAGGGMAFTRDRRRLFWSTCDAKGKFVVVDRSGALVPILADEEDVAGWAPIPGSGDVVVNENRDGKSGLWRIGLSGATAPTSIPMPRDGIDQLTVSHDGTLLVSSTVAGLSVEPLNGAGPARTITSDPSDTSPAFRYGDGQVVFTRAFGDGTHRVMTVPVEGGEATPLRSPEATRSRVPREPTSWRTGTVPRLCASGTRAPAPRGRCHGRCRPAPSSGRRSRWTVAGSRSSARRMISSRWTWPRAPSCGRSRATGCRCWSRRDTRRRASSCGASRGPETCGWPISCSERDDTGDLGDSSYMELACATICHA